MYNIAVICIAMEVYYKLPIMLNFLWECNLRWHSCNICFYIILLCD